MSQGQQMLWQMCLVLLSLYFQTNKEEKKEKKKKAFLSLYNGHWSILTDNCVCGHLHFIFSFLLFCFFFFFMFSLVYFLSEHLVFFFFLLLLIHSFICFSLTFSLFFYVFYELKNALKKSFEIKTLEFN